MADSVLLTWLMLLVVFLVVEGITLGLTTIWFAGGALVALIAGMCGANVTVQVVIFFVVSIILLFFVRPSACRRFNSRRTKTGTDLLIGAEGKVLETIDNFNQKGCVYVQGKEWTARSADGSVIEAGQKVTINEIAGVKLIVTQNETIEKNEKEEKEVV